MRGDVAYPSPPSPSVPRQIDTLALRIEEAALNATVVREQMLYDGWLVRWAPSHAKRARSINVIAAPHHDLEEKLAFCKTLYARAGQPLIFRLTSTSSDSELDGQLHTRGFNRFDETCVMSLPMQARQPALPHTTLRYENADAERFARLTGELRFYTPDHVVEHGQRLAAIAVPCIRLFARDEAGRCVAAGMVVVDGHLAGIFDVVVDEHVRRRGYARQLMNRLLDVGYEAGARTAYLQVEYSNTAARRLYASLGFADRYTYWYRMNQHN